MTGTGMIVLSFVIENISNVQQKLQRQGTVIKEEKVN